MRTAVRAWVGILGMLSAVASASAAAQELVVSAAASLTNAFRDIGKAFEAAHPGATVVFNFAASDILLTQIAKGAPADVFASADQDAMNRAERDQLLLPGTRRDFAANQLVLVVPVAAAAVPDLPTLATAHFRRIAVGSPQTVPAGRYAKEALDAAGIWSTLEPRLVFTQNVRQALDYVARDEADAGFVYATDAAIMPKAVKVALDVATATPVRYPIAVVAASRQPALARAFASLVSETAGQRILVQYGFRAP
jgi:molybdate transport system substrate-binding protein